MAAQEQTLILNEVFDSIQGEGVSAGQPRTFVRLAGCNLHCVYCDTKYTWDWKNYDRRKEAKPVALARLIERLALAKGVVFTGGEPLLQQAKIEAIAARLPAGLHIEIETNGTLEPSPALLARVSQWNVSPKLSDAGDDESERIAPRALRSLGGSGRAWLKFVVAEAAQLAEVETLVKALGWPRSRVLLQPQALTRATLLRSSPSVRGWCEQHGFRFSPRLHVAIWSDARGK